LRQRRRRYNDEERGRAVADVAAVGVAEAARMHGVPKTTLHAWTRSPQWKKRPEASTKGSEAAPARGRRFTAEQRAHALALVASGMKRVDIASVMGTTVESVRLWVKAAEAKGAMPAVPVAKPTQSTTMSSSRETPSPTTRAAAPTRSLYAPRDPGQGLSEYETAAILEIKKRHPSMGPAQIRAQLKRFKKWRLSVKAIARVLRAHGYDLVRRESRPEGPEPVRFEAPHRNAMWQVDYAELRVAGEKRHLCVVLDDFSRYVVGHRLTEHPSADAALEVLRAAIARHGKPEAVRTDRGGGFKSAEFTSALEAELIDHIVGRSYHPQGGGKVESLIGTVRRELWDTEHFGDLAEAERRLGEFIDDYNERRAHMGIDGLTPSDRYFARADRVLATIDAISRKRQGQFVQHSAAENAPLEELLGPHAGAPLEVLRLVLHDGKLELRFCGARCVLGPLEGVSA
jgi:transposase InsO family protein